MILASLPASIPSPEQGVWHLGPIPIRAYALCIIAGVLVAAILANRAWVARGGRHGTIYDLTIWAVPFGLVGARLYHVVTDHQLYFSEGADPWRALYVWEGGLGIWGGVALGAVGVWLGCRTKGIPLPAVADTCAPYIVLAQAIGRWGNWFNQELYGGPTTLPWGLEISPAFREAGLERFETFHPTFLYESLWDIGVCVLVIWATKRFALGHGRAFALYVAGYTAGRAWIEYLRVDEVNEILGLRLNLWTSLVVFVAAVAFIVISARLRPGVETEVEPGPSERREGENGRQDGEESGRDGTARADVAEGGSEAAGSGPSRLGPAQEG